MKYQFNHVADNQHPVNSYKNNEHNNSIELKKDCDNNIFLLKCNKLLMI